MIDKICKNCKYFGNFLTRMDYSGRDFFRCERHGFYNDSPFAVITTHSCDNFEPKVKSEYILDKADDKPKIYSCDTCSKNDYCRTISPGYRGPCTGHEESNLEKRLSEIEKLLNHHSKEQDAHYLSLLEVEIKLKERMSNLESQIEKLQQKSLSEDVDLMHELDRLRNDIKELQDIAHCKCNYEIEERLKKLESRCNLDCPLKNKCAAADSGYIPEFDSCYWYREKNTNIPQYAQMKKQNLNNNSNTVTLPLGKPFCCKCGKQTAPHLLLHPSSETICDDCMRIICSELSGKYRGE